MHRQPFSRTADEFYSEGDYWWPAPAAGGPYIKYDGAVIPAAFNRHRKLLSASPSDCNAV